MVWFKRGARNERLAKKAERDRLVAEIRLRRNREDTAFEELRKKNRKD